MSTDEPAEVTTVTVGPDRVTAQDVRNLNRASVERAAAIARLAGTAIICIGLVILLAWGWLLVRSQMNLEGGFFSFSFDGEPEDPGFKERLDAFASFTTVLAEAAVVTALGVGLRLLADYAQTRVGGTVTGFVEGDAFGDDPDLDSP
jgi:hypothetical protein